MALEGTTLTLVGLIKYDTNEDCFMLTNLSQCIGGGLEEAYVQISNKIAVAELLKDRVLNITTVLLGIGCYFIIKWWDMKRRREAREYELRESEASL